MGKRRKKTLGGILRGIALSEKSSPTFETRREIADKVGIMHPVGEALLDIMDVSSDVAIDDKDNRLRCSYNNKNSIRNAILNLSVAYTTLEEEQSKIESLPNAGTVKPLNL